MLSRSRWEKNSPGDLHRPPAVASCLHRSARRKFVQKNSGPCWAAVNTTVQLPGSGATLHTLRAFFLYREINQLIPAAAAQACWKQCFTRPAPGRTQGAVTASLRTLAARPSPGRDQGASAMRQPASAAPRSRRLVSDTGRIRSLPPPSSDRVPAESARVVRRRMPWSWLLACSGTRAGLSGRGAARVVRA